MAKPQSKMTNILYVLVTKLLKIEYCGRYYGIRAWLLRIGACLRARKLNHFDGWPFVNFQLPASFYDITKVTLSTPYRSRHTLCRIFSLNISEKAAHDDIKYIS